MGKIFCLMGKSSSGKDSIYRELFQASKEKLERIVPYTTRPIREGECEGKEYHFVGEDKVSSLEQEGKIIELRAYNTVHGIWKYFTVDDGQIDLESNNYLMVGVLQTYLNIREYFGDDKVVPIYIEVEDGERLARALGRERLEPKPRYAEMCRRFLADSEDFSEERLEAAGITKRFENRQLVTTISEIVDYIEKMV